MCVSVVQGRGERTGASKGVFLDRLDLHVDEAREIAGKILERAAMDWRAVRRNDDGHGGSKLAKEMGYKALRTEILAFWYSNYGRLIREALGVTHLRPADIASAREVSRLRAKEQWSLREYRELRSLSGKRAGYVAEKRNEFAEAEGDGEDWVYSHRGPTTDSRE